MTKYISIAVLSLALLIPATSNASRYKFDNSQSGELIPGKVYLGVQAGQFSLEADTSGSDSVDMDHLGFTFGGDINEYLALEFAYSQTVSEERDAGATSSTDTMGLFLVGRTQGPVYFKGRVGYSIVEQDIDLVSADINDNVYGIAYGIGAGIKFNNTLALEIEYTIFPETDDESDDLGSFFNEDFDAEFVTVGLVWSIE
jgi:opacity protein-like surface antigen